MAGRYTQNYILLLLLLLSSYNPIQPNLVLLLLLLLVLLLAPWSLASRSALTDYCLRVLLRVCPFSLREGME